MDKFSIIKQLGFLFLTLFVLFTPNKLSTKVRIVGLVALFVLGFIVFEPASYAFRVSSDLNIFEKYPAKTELSKKATQLQVGMTRRQVIKLLGGPTWAEHINGVPLALIWKNGHCNPVFVTFNRHMRVNGMDEGRAECLDVDYAVHLEDQFLCDHSANKRYCKI